MIDDLLILDWDSKDDEYKLNLNYLYVSPNFISIKKIKFLFSGSGRSIIFFSLIPIAYIDPYIFPILILFNTSPIYSTDQFNFDVTEIEIIEEGNKFIGKHRGKITTDNNVKIEADEFIYDKSLNTLKLKGNILIDDIDQDLKIFSQEAIYYKNQEICVKDLNVGDIVYSLNDDGEVFEDPIRNITTYDEEVEVYKFNVPQIYSYITNDIISHNREKYESGAPNPFHTPFQMNLASPETEVFEIETNQTGTFFKKEMLGADLTIFPSTGSTDMDIQNKGVTFDRRFVIKQQPLTAKIRKLGAKGRVIVPDIRGLMVTNRLNANKDVVFSEYQDFGPSSYSMSYQKPVTASFRVINKQSYSKINLTK